MIADILSGLLAINLTAGAAIILALLLRRPARRLFGARNAYRLWLAVPIAAIAALLPRAPENSVLPVLPLEEMADTAAFVLFSSQQSGGMAAPGASLPVLLLALWAAGALAFLIIALAAHRRGVARFGRLTPSGEMLRASNTGPGPALIGALRARIVLPADFETRFDEREQALVLAHERAHLASGDTFTNTFIVLFSALNWFNPLVHIAAFYARVDQELACDAAVAARFPGERRTYAQALLKTQLAPAPLPLGCYWPGRSSNLLKERIDMLAVKITPLRTLVGGAALAALLAGAGYAAWAAQPAETELPVERAAVSLPPGVSLTNSVVGGSNTESSELLSEEWKADVRALIEDPVALREQIEAWAKSDAEDRAEAIREGRFNRARMIDGLPPIGPDVITQDELHNLPGGPTGYIAGSAGPDGKLRFYRTSALYDAATGNDSARRRQEEIDFARAELAETRSRAAAAGDMETVEASYVVLDYLIRTQGQ